MWQMIAYVSLAVVGAGLLYIWYVMTRPSSNKEDNNNIDANE